jgi:hypothetical protein
MAVGRQRIDSQDLAEQVVEVPGLVNGSPQQPPSPELMWRCPSGPKMIVPP